MSGTTTSELSLGQMKVNRFGILLVSIVLTLACACSILTPDASPTAPAPAPTLLTEKVIKLPQPRLAGPVSLEETLLKRRSVREYANLPLTIEEVSQLLWAAQGVTSEWGGRTAPSAGALYPLELYLVVGNVESLTSGVYKYSPEEHELVQVSGEDVREELAEAALGQVCIRKGAIDIVVAAVYERTASKYGDRAVRYVHLEAGHAAQNIYLQATALNLGTVTVGAFYDDQVKLIMGMPEEENPLYLIPVGRKP